MTGSETRAGSGTFLAEVVDVRELARAGGRQLWQLALNQTSFEPVAGVSPAGSLQAVSRSGATLVINVLAVQQDDTGQMWHTVNKPLQPGTMVRAHIGAGDASALDESVPV